MLFPTNSKQMNQKLVRSKGRVVHTNSQYNVQTDRRQVTPNKTERIATTVDEFSHSQSFSRIPSHPGHPLSRPQPPTHTHINAHVLLYKHNNLLTSAPAYVLQCVYVYTICMTITYTILYFMLLFFPLSFFGSVRCTTCVCLCVSLCLHECGIKEKSTK